MYALSHPATRGLLGRRWTLEILDKLAHNVMRPAHVMRALPGLSHRLAYARLDQMRHIGWVERRDNGTYPREVHYCLRDNQNWKQALQCWQRLGLGWDCARRLLGSRWYPPILYATSIAPCCFRTLETLIPGISAKVLSERLHQMETYGLILQGGRDGKSWLLSPTGQEAFQALLALALQAEQQAKMPA